MNKVVFFFLDAAVEPPHVECWTKLFTMVFFFHMDMIWNRIGGKGI
jgi:hypothetical protein